MSTYEKIADGPFGGAIARAAGDRSWVLIREGVVDPQRIATWSKVQHARVVPIHGVTADGRLAHVLVEGVPLDHLRNVRTPKPHLLALILADLLDVLSALEPERHGALGRDQIIVGFDGRTHVLGPGRGGAPGVDRITIGDMFAELLADKPGKVDKSGKLRWLADRARGALPDVAPFASARAMRAALGVLMPEHADHRSELAAWIQPELASLDRFAKLGAFVPREQASPAEVSIPDPTWHPLIADLELTELEAPWPA